MLKIKHDPRQLVDSAAIPILFTVLFTYLFGGAIGGTPGDYLQSLLPGVLTMSVAIVTMYGGARLAQDLRGGAVDRFRGNIFVQPSTMPGWLRSFVDINPLSHIATAARALMNGVGPAGDGVAWSLAATAVIALLCAPIALHLYSKQD
jgi:ABC-2 type transport system permease protein